MSFTIRHSSFAQDIHSSQYYNYPVLYNPATAGTGEGSVRVNTGYKDQWSHFTTPYRTMLLSTDLSILKESISKGFVGTGVTIMRDQAGDARFGITQLNLSLSTAKMFNERHTIAVGLQGGFAQRSMDAERLQWGSQFDGQRYNGSLSTDEPLLSESFFFSDFSGGVYWKFHPSDNLKIRSGASVHHINRPKQFFYVSDKKLYSRMTFNADAAYRMSSSSSELLPSLFISTQGPDREIIAGLFLRRILDVEPAETMLLEKSVSFGALYRVSDAFIIATQLQFKNIMLGISYDINVSGLSVASKGLGGVELSLTWLHPGKEKQADDPRVKF